jgi:hypothetical protein
MKIKSTEKLAPSQTEGLCNVSREMLFFNQNLKQKTVTVLIQDSLIQENPRTITITKTVKDELGNRVPQTEEIDIIERKIIKTLPSQEYTYPDSKIDLIFESVGSNITLGSNNYSEQHNTNKLAIFLAQTITASENGSGYYKMIDWVLDNNPQVRIVRDFNL